MTRFQVFLRVVFFHTLLLGLIVLVPLLKGCEWFPKKEQIITVDLASLPLPPPPADDPEDPVDEEEDPEDLISEATPVPQPTATPPPAPTATVPEATPTPEATPVPTSTPRPQPTPTPKWKAATPEEIAERIRNQQQNIDPPVAVPTMSSQQIQDMISRGLPTVSGGGGTSMGQGNPGNGVNFGGVESELQRRLYSAWVQPIHLSANAGLNAVASVKVHKNGNIGSSRILRSSGNLEFDESVKRALSVVKFAKPLPPDYNGSEYTIETTFSFSQ